MTIAIYPGSFDPITNGHLDVLGQASKLFEKVIIVVMTNPSKKVLIPVEDRLRLIRESVGHLTNVEVDSYEGLTVEYARSKNATALIRGLRAVSDFEYEMQMAQANKNLNASVHTIFLVPAVENNFLSSSITKEIALFGGDISGIAPKAVIEYFKGIVKHKLG